MTRTIILTTTAIVAVHLSCSCSMPPEAVSSLETAAKGEALGTYETVGSVAFRASGGLCPLVSQQCWSEVRIDSTGSVGLEDAEGVQATTLDERDLKYFNALVNSPLMIELLQARAWNCGQAFDGTADLSVSFVGGESRLFEGAERCIGGGSPGAGLPLARLGAFLTHVRSQYSDCADSGAPLGAGLGQLYEGRGICL